MRFAAHKDIDGPITSCWAASLGSAIKQAQTAGDRDDGSTYYKHVLDALEQLVFEKSIATQHVVAAREKPGGQPMPRRRTDSPSWGGYGLRGRWT
jgi:hypothetical protein